MDAVGHAEGFRLGHQRGFARSIPGDHQMSVRELRRAAGEGAQPVSDAFLVDQAADHPDQRGIRREVEVLAQRRPCHFAIQRLESQPVVDGRNFGGRRALDGHAEARDRPRNGDPGAGQPPKQAVQQPHRQQSAKVVVVVAAGNDRAEAQAFRRRHAVQVGVDQVSVDDVGVLSAQRAAQPTDHAEIEVALDRNPRHRDAIGFEQRHEIVDRLGGVFDQQQRDVDAARLERGQQNRQVTLRPGDPGRLDDVSDFH